MTRTTIMDRIVYDAESTADFLTEAVHFTSRHPSEVRIDHADGSDGSGCRMRLIEQVLTDGSTVFDIIFGG